MHKMFSSHAQILSFYVTQFGMVLCEILYEAIFSASFIFLFWPILVYFQGWQAYNQNINGVCLKIELKSVLLFLVRYCCIERSLSRQHCLFAQPDTKKVFPYFFTLFQCCILLLRLLQSNRNKIVQKIFFNILRF